MSRTWWTWFRCLCRCCSSVSPCFCFVWIARSSMYMESHPWAISRRKIMFIIIWKVAGELVSPKNITVGSKSPSGVRNAAFHSSPSLIRTLLYPHRMSNLVKRVQPARRSMVWGISGDTLRFFLRPTVDRAIVLDWAELPVFLFDEEEIRGVGTPRFSDGASCQVFGDELLNLLYF